MEKIDVVYDIELNPNCFIYVGYELISQRFIVFEISKRRDDRYIFIEYLKGVRLMIGFNNLSFDYSVIHYLIKMLFRRFKGSKLTQLLYLKGQELIKSKNRWEVIIRKPMIPQADLLLINHYDNFAKATSLKILEFNMNMDIIQNLPYAFDKFLTTEEIDHVINYCKNDVKATYLFFMKNSKKFAFRKKFSKIYKQDFTNYNDVKIGGEILLDALAKGMNMSKYQIKKMRTHRTAMYMSDIIFDYVKFESKELNILLDWWKDKIIFETKGQFTELSLDEVAPLLPYCNNTLKKGKLKNLNIIVDDFQFDFGTGGIHGACHPGVFKSDQKNDLILIDVSSYYPNLAYYNNLHPAHIPMEIFGTVIKNLYDRRMQAKVDGDKETVDAIKLALNGYLYGNSNSKYSFMFDSQFMMGICVNGQLLLTMMAEKIIRHNIKVVQVNTDGVLVSCPKSKRETLDNIVKEWAELTRLKLDYDYFDFVIQRDVNNYMAQYTNGKMKYKGAFDFEYVKNGDWHKNFSALVIPKTLDAYFRGGQDITQWITRYTDSKDFFLRTKFDKNTKLVERELGDIMTQRLLQNVTRYYISKTGNEFIKIMKPLKGQENDREFQVESGYLCKASNHTNIIDFNDINYDYYIKKVQDIINTIEDYIAIEDLSFTIIDDTL